MNKRDNIIKWSIISIFVSLYIITSIVSTIHVIDFFKLSNPGWLAITLAIAFELGAAASLSALIILDKTSKALVWILFILITGIQILGNMYYAYSHVQNYQGWIELFGLIDEEPIFQKRILSLVSGAILPIVALGFIKSLVDYIRPEEPVSAFPTAVNDQITDAVTQAPHVEIEEDEDIEVDPPNENLINAKRVWDTVRELREEGKLPEVTEEDIENEPTALANSEYRLEDVEEDTSEESKEKIKEIEKKLARAIASDSELKDKLNEAIKKLDTKDKYTKKENSSGLDEINQESRKVFGSM